MIKAIFINAVQVLQKKITYLCTILFAILVKNFSKVSANKSQKKNNVKERKQNDGKEKQNRKSEDTV